MFSDHLTKAMFSGARLLVISPHADDETFGCGGTIARALKEGAEVAVLLVSVADLKHYSSTHQNVTAQTREAEFESAMRVLGVTRTDILFRDEHTHMRLDAIPRRDLVARIERDSPLAIDRIRPDILMFPAVSFNQDHEAVFKAVYSACRPHLPGDKHFVRVVLTYDQPQLAWNHAAFRPNFYIDISDHLDMKLTAFRCHASQMRPEPHHASVENVERLARLRGSEVSVAAAEAFECHRVVV
jgi:N-acetylglucosamine malate deacetylase 1